MSIDKLLAKWCKLASKDNRTMLENNDLWNLSYYLKLRLGLIKKD